MLTFLPAALAFGAGALGWVVYRINDAGVKWLRTTSHAAHLNYALRSYFTDHPDWVARQSRARPGESIPLAPDALRRLIVDASAHYGADPAVADVTLDAWHRPLHVELSPDESGGVVHRITSDGPDRREGTPDDITFSSDIFDTPPVTQSH